MPRDHKTSPASYHAVRNARLRQHSLERAQSSPPLARMLVTIRVESLQLTRLELARRSGISRGTLRDLELGLHVPTRRILQRFLQFCQDEGVPAEQLEELRRLYAGAGDTLEELIARLELRAGSSRHLAQSVGISPATLWEYRRGHFPLPLALLQQMCAAVGEDAAAAEALWLDAERQRLRQRGYPEPLAELWALVGRQGLAERHLPSLGVSTAVLRRLRYLELPAWSAIAPAAHKLCRNEQELRRLEHLWRQAGGLTARPVADPFGRRLHRLRQQQGIRRRELADLFGIGGKKPARIIKYIEEDGFYSAQAYPAGLAALLSDDPAEQERLLTAWRQRRQQLHRRHRPEMRLDLRLAREQYGFDVADMEAILGYSSLEYQKIERGVSPLLETARQRIVQAIHQAGRRRVEDLLRCRCKREAERDAWQAPPSLPTLISLLARREGGLIPLSRLLRRAGVAGLWATRLRGILRGQEVPCWPLIEAIGRACKVEDMTDVQEDWKQRYRSRLQQRGRSPLGVEVRLLLAEMASSVRAFSPRLGFNYSVLVRNLQQLDRDEAIRWSHVERILQAAGIDRDTPRWHEIHALWSTSGDRNKRNGRR
jgi:transcriptional regulator with XRE-family HTH domain